MQDRINPGPNQESVWDYPRPPQLEACEHRIKIVVDEETIVLSDKSFRVLETSHPPVYYLPSDSVRMDLMRQTVHGSFCEWKGHAHYFSLNIAGREIENVAWSYKSPTERFAAIAGFLAFYPSRVDACFVDDERVTAQDGDFYGGWITSKIVGPFKGAPGTLGW